MRFIKPFIAAIVAGCLAFVAPAFAEKQVTEGQEQVSQTSISVRTDYLSQYIFRGLACSEKPVIQPTISATHGNFSLIGFGNFDTQADDLNEADLTVNFTGPLTKDVTLSAGYTLLTFPNTESDNTQEIYTGVLFGKTLKPSIKVYRDFDEGKGTYGELSLGRDFSLGKAVASVARVLCYNNHFFRDDNGLSHFELRTSMPISLPLGENVSITPIVNYSEALDNDFNDELYGGISLNIAF